MVWLEPMVLREFKVQKEYRAYRLGLEPMDLREYREFKDQKEYRAYWLEWLEPMDPWEYREFKVQKEFKEILRLKV